MKSFFSSRQSLLWLCIVFFLVPFGLRGSRLSLQRMKNDVKDWLPDEFRETGELKWFAKHFAGERFVVATWPGCSEDDPRFHQMLEKLQREVEPQSGRLAPAVTAEEAEDRKAREIGAKHDLFFSGQWHENWGGRGERWLRGYKDTWYFITPDGKLYRWDVGGNVMGRLMSGIRRWRESEPVRGTLIAEWSPKHNPQRYFDSPELLTARLLGSVLTGPDVLEKLAAHGGPLWPRGDLSDGEKKRIARNRAVERLTGTLFGHPIPVDFQWTVDGIAKIIPTEKLPEDWESQAQGILQRIADKHYDGDVGRLAEGTKEDQQRNWLELFDGLHKRYQIDAPAPQTAFVVTLSEAGKRQLDRIVGRPMLGKPRGQLLALAESCGVSALGESPELRLGGPPVDNVAIDEEGSITLVRLLGFSLVLGVVLSYISFRSVVITIMVFLVGGISAIVSLSMVYWTGASVDAVLLSMPSLVYVLGLSGAVHIVNYYRDACREHGVVGAPGRALAHGWGPCTLAAATTALGLISLYASSILPIRKFGFYSAVGVLATLALLFFYLPSALQLWPPGYHRQPREESGRGFAARIGDFWSRVGDFIIARYGWVIVGCGGMMIFFACGLYKINTDVQLLKLFDGDAKIIRDYQWLERNMGELVPMELVIRVPREKISAPLDTNGKPIEPSPEVLAARSAESPTEKDVRRRLEYSLLERVEMAYHIQKIVEREFGEAGRDKVGRGLSAATFTYQPTGVSSSESLFDREAHYRRVLNLRLQERYTELLDTDYLRQDTLEGHEGDELWRVSLRLGALNDVDYGQFVHELEDVVEPVLRAYRYRDEILRNIDRLRRSRGLPGGFDESAVVLLGAPTPDSDAPPSAGPDDEVDQTRIFCETLDRLLIQAGLDGDYLPEWVDLREQTLDERFESREEMLDVIQQDVDCLVLIRADESVDWDFLQKHANVAIDATDHVYRRAVESSWLASDLREPGTPRAADVDDGGIHVIYTGVVPIVYKAQRALLKSLAESIGWAFVMIAGVMMVLLRTGPWRLNNTLSFRGGLLSMIPNVFPVVVIFGAMGHRGVLVDIGSMMTASVAMGVAVDDTIHFLTWFRAGIRDGLDRNRAIKQAYDRCATAMTQTTLIGGVGLSVFAISTFTPTQRFGILMLAMLAAALVGDLIFLPALLASPWGRFFAPGEKKRGRRGQGGDSKNLGASPVESTNEVEMPEGKRLDEGQPQQTTAPLARRQATRQRHP